jgi:hypothetical protein
MRSNLIDKHLREQRLEGAVFMPKNCFGQHRDCQIEIPTNQD